MVSGTWSLLLTQPTQGWVRRSLGSVNAPHVRVFRAMTKERGQTAATQHVQMQVAAGLACRSVVLHPQNLACSGGCSAGV